MAAIEFNHVAIYGDDIDELVEFYTAVFGLERLPAPNLTVPVAWLRCGDQQLHIAERDTEPPQYHHFSVAVDDFEELFEFVRDRGLFDEELAPHGGLPMFALPDGAVQMYFRDPAGNLVEACWPDISTLDADVREHITDVTDEHPQSPTQAKAALFLDP